MRVSKEQAAANRDRIVAVASRLLRERGVDGVGIDGLMQAAGLTHGGFYKNFASKDALVAEACARAMVDNSAMGTSAPEQAPQEVLEAWVKSYLSTAHCDAIGEGCAFAALAADAGRRQGPIRHAFTTGLEVWIERLERLFPGRPAARRARALTSMAAAVGAVLLARATDDEAMRAELLSATAAMILGSKSNA